MGSATPSSQNVIPQTYRTYVFVQAGGDEDLTTQHECDVRMQSPEEKEYALLRKLQRPNLSGNALSLNTPFVA